MDGGNFSLPSKSWAPFVKGLLLKIYYSNKFYIHIICQWVLLVRPSTFLSRQLDRWTFQFLKHHFLTFLKHFAFIVIPYKCVDRSKTNYLWPFLWSACNPKGNVGLITLSIFKANAKLSLHFVDSKTWKKAGSYDILSVHM